MCKSKFGYDEVINYKQVNDLSIWLLQHYGISITWNEMLGIKLTDGLYDENQKVS